MKLQLKPQPEPEEIPYLEDLSPGQLFLDNSGCINLVVADHQSETHGLIYWDEGRPILADEDIMAQTEVSALLSLEDLEFSD